MQDVYRIIIAEDEPSLATLFPRLILHYYPTAIIRTFSNGLKALAAYDQAGADMLFVNHGLPDMDGQTLIRTVRARGDMVPMIGMSGNPHLHDAYMAAGAMAFVGGSDVIAQLPTLLQRFLPPVLQASAIGL